MSRGKQRQRRHRGGTMSERPLPIEVRPGLQGQQSGETNESASIY